MSKTCILFITNFLISVLCVGLGPGELNIVSYVHKNRNRSLISAYLSKKIASLDEWWAILCGGHLIVAFYFHCH